MGCTAGGTSGGTSRSDGARLAGETTTRFLIEVHIGDIMTSGLIWVSEGNQKEDSACGGIFLPLNIAILFSGVKDHGIGASVVGTLA
jgi:hypothetical protein